MKNQSLCWFVGICTGCELEKYYMLTMGKFSGTIDPEVSRKGEIVIFWLLLLKYAPIS